MGDRILALDEFSALGMDMGYTCICMSCRVVYVWYGLFMVIYGSFMWRFVLCLGWFFFSFSVHGVGLGWLGWDHGFREVGIWE